MLTKFNGIRNLQPTFELNHFQSARIHSRDKRFCMTSTRGEALDDKRYAVFCYGSNSTKQLCERVCNQNLISYGSYVAGYKRIFVGNAIRWRGGVASIIQTDNLQDKCIGSVVYLSEKELSLLDGFEGIAKGNDPFCCDFTVNHYRRHWVDAFLQDESNTTTSIIKAIAYVCNCHKWEAYPSDAYLAACYANISPFWPNLEGDKSLMVYCSENKLRGQYYEPYESAEKLLSFEVNDNTNELNAQTTDIN